MMMIMVCSVNVWKCECMFKTQKIKKKFIGKCFIFLQILVMYAYIHIHPCLTFIFPSSLLFIFLFPMIFSEFVKSSQIYSMYTWKREKDQEENWEEFVIINIFDVIYFLNTKGTSHHNLSHKKFVEWITERYFFGKVKKGRWR